MASAAVAVAVLAAAAVVVVAVHYPHNFLAAAVRYFRKSPAAAYAAFVQYDKLLGAA